MMKSQPSPIKKHGDTAACLGLFLAAFIVYLRTLAPSLLSGDSAEFQTIGATLGLGHPTGYPVYILLAKLFTFLPFGEPAYRVNLLSTVSAATTITFGYLILRKLGAWNLPSLFGAIALALTPLFWDFSSMAEVYTPATTFLTSILLAVLIWKETRQIRWIYLAGLLGGLSLGIHTMVLLSGGGIILYLILSGCTRKEWIYAISGVLTGGAIFLGAFLWLDQINSPAGYYNTVVYPSLSVWNLTPGDFDSPFERLAFLYFPPQFRGQFFAADAGEVLARLSQFAKGISGRIFHSILGIGFLFIQHKNSSRGWREALLMIILLVTYILFASTYLVFDFYNYYIPAILILAILIGLGVQALLFAVTFIRRIPKFIPNALAIIFLASVLFSNSQNLVNAWQERMPPGLGDWEVAQFRSPYARKLEAERIVNSLEDNAILFTDWDRVYSYYYVAHIEQSRTRLDFHETFPQEGVVQFASSAVEYIEANIDTRPVYFSERPSFLANEYIISRTGDGLYQISRK